MNRLEFYRQLARQAETRILYYVVDGLGGLPRAPGEPTELEAASTPTFDRLAREGATGLITPVLPGVAPGSGPAHLALFGYEPTEVIVGRGVLAALGIGVELQAGDVAARINFCTLDDRGNVTDRRAGRIATEEAVPLTERLDGIELDDGVELAVHHVEQYRACLVLRGSGLDGRIADTDPQATGVPPDAPEPLHPEAKAAAELAAEFLAAAHELLAGEPRANGILLRGFDTYRPIPGLGDLYGLKPAAIAAYPMYRGVARLVGMTCLDVEDDPDAIVAAVGEARAEHDFLFVHYKATDSRGEDGDFDGKVAEIEKADALISRLLEDDYDVVMVTGDHSTPATLEVHSWHPVPLLIQGPACRPVAAVETFGETDCRRGSLGMLRSVDVLPLVLAHAGRLEKFGA